MHYLRFLLACVCIVVSMSPTGNASEEVENEPRSKFNWPAVEMHKYLSDYHKTQRSEPTQCLVSGPTKAVIGFPCIFLFKMEGPDFVPRMTWGSLGAGYVDLWCVFENRDTGQSYRLRSAAHILADSEIIAGYTETNMRLRDGEQLVQILDVNAAFTSNNPRYTRFRDLPSGRYTASFKYLFSDTESNEIEIELIEPTQEETRFIEIFRNVLFRKWERLQRTDEQIAALRSEVDRLSEMARNQLALFFFMRKNRYKDLTLEELEAIEVPEYLKIVKTWELLRHKIENQVDGAVEVGARFVEEHPEFKSKYDLVIKGEYKSWMYW